MSEWKEYTLGELTTDGKGTYGIAASAVDYCAELPTYLRITDINDDGTIDFAGLKSVDAPNSSNYILKENDIVFARTGASTGRSYFYDKRDGDFVYAGFLIKFSLDPQKVNPQILKYYTHSRVYYNWVHSFENGATRGNINAKTLAEMKIILPPRQAQDKIVSILSSLDDKIAVNRRICENLEAQAQALFKNWFVDFAPFKDGKFVESELGMIPEGWRVGTLSEVININTTYSLKKGVLAPYLDMKNMPTQGSYPIKVEEKEYQGGMKFKNGDALMARITPCLENGKVAYVNFLKDDEIGFGSTEYIVLSTKDASYSELSYFLCRETNFVNYATKNMNGSSGRQRVSGETIGNYKIAIPTRDVVDDLMPIFRNAMREFAVLGAENLRLSALRDSLLPKLMSGEIKI